MDMPEANDLTVGIMALVAQAEREAIFRRTKEALAVANARGVKLGNPNGAGKPQAGWQGRRGASSGYHGECGGVCAGLSAGNYGHPGCGGYLVFGRLRQN